ncbi:MAG: heavy metal-binding domain-containing protein [Acidiferrobacterales bacterium]|nr:heavy metal-binding domain-containing protein [Acidiferrobacterales bacterium]
MKNFVTLSLIAVFVSASLLTSDAYARDNRLRFSIADALNSESALGKINPGIRLYFSGQAIPPVIKSYGSGRTNKKTNAFNKTDLFACEWVFISAIIQMQKKAEQLGANAVVNIKSNYKNIEFSSPYEFECGAGNVIAGVALKGEFVVTE